MIPRGPVLALDIGGTKIAAAVVSAGADVGPVCRVPTPARDGAAAVVAAVVAAGRAALLDGAGGQPPALVGIGSAGVIDPVTGTVTHATDALPGWAGTRLAQQVAAGLSAPAYAINDVHAHALGEARYGAGRGQRDVLVVAVGTGVGGALVRDGAVVVGAHAAAGHVGHVAVAAAAGLVCPCGRTGHLEALASGPGIAAAYARAVGSTSPGAAPLTGGEVAALAAGDGPDSAKAREVLETAGRALGQVVGGLLNVLDPDVVVLTGSVADAGEGWWDAVRAGVAEQAMDLVASTPIVPATAGSEAALLGAAAHARAAAS
ncbi:MAG TPA: ROK family protein [Dermatophilaceae bacterium]|mgnify:CR=1 FL=1|nr:ROK family protein [Dermatophilaceae bacterium]